MKDSSFKDFIAEKLGFIEGITFKSMFGGYGIYKDGIVFAIIADDQLFFKVNDELKKQYESMGSSPFTYENNKGKKISMSYWELPADVLENDEELEKWVDQSVNVSVSLKSKRKRV
jgi:DNA transformation protein